MTGGLYETRFSSDVFSGPYVGDRDELAIRRVGSPRGVGCGFQWSAVRGFLRFAARHPATTRLLIRNCDPIAE
jgi:hypothetical protein